MARQVKKVWQPLSDGEYTMPLWDRGTYTLHVCDDGDTLEAWPDGEQFKFKDGSPKQVEEIGVAPYRLCRTVEVQPDAASGKAIEVTPELVAALKVLTGLHVVGDESAAREVLRGVLAKIEQGGSDE